MVAFASHPSSVVAQIAAKLAELESYDGKSSYSNAELEKMTLLVVELEQLEACKLVMETLGLDVDGPMRMAVLCTDSLKAYLKHVSLPPDEA